MVRRLALVGVRHARLKSRGRSRLPCRAKSREGHSLRSRRPKRLLGEECRDHLACLAGVLLFSVATLLSYRT